MADDATPQYRLTVLPNCRERLEVLGKKAMAAGIATKFVEQLIEIRKQLESRPRDWGDPNFRYHGLGAVSYLRIFGQFRVVYFVDDVQPIVFLREVELLDDGKEPATGA